MKAHEVTIKVDFAGVNRADLLQSQGKYPPPPGVTDILGLEVSGVISGIGRDVAGWNIGDSVCALLAGGGYAHDVTVDARHCLPIPAGYSLEEAACLPECALTVWDNLVLRAGLKAGDSCLIQGAASGIGVFAIAIARMLGAIPFACVRGLNRSERLKQLGAEAVLDFNSDFADAFRQYPVDIVLDMIGGETVAKNLSCLGVGGRHVSLAFPAGRMVTLDMAHIMRHRLVVTGSTLRNRSADEKADLVAHARAVLWPLLERNSFRPPICADFRLENATLALEMLEKGGNFGKIMLRVA